MATRTRKVKDAIDLNTNELIYFTSHAKATYMSDGTTVEDAIKSIGSNGSGTGSSAYPIVIHESFDVHVTLTPNTFHVWEDVNDDLILLLGEEIDGVMNEYLFQFSRDPWIIGGSSLSLPSTVKWADDIIPDFSDNSFVYQVSIVNNCATMLKFKKS